MNPRESLAANRGAVIELAARHGAGNVRVFGSVARGEDTEESDVDLLVALEPGRSLLDHAALKIEMEELLRRPVDVATERGLKPEFRERILREAVAL